METTLLYKEESYKIIGAAIEVHKVLGCGFTEPVYQEALEHEFKLRGIPYEREKVLKFNYKDITLEKDFRVDYLCYGKIIVELKAVTDIIEDHYAQVYNYLKTTGCELGILINFGNMSLEYNRIPCSLKWKSNREVE